MSALVLTYHGVEPGPGPLFVEPELFQRQLDTIVESGASVLTISQLAAAIREERLPESAVAITFDDGFASVARAAAPLLIERGLVATIYCVAGHLGGINDWPSQPRGIPRRPLATAAELAELSAVGFELGSHGFEHAPLVESSAAFLHREVIDARRALEDAVGASVSTFAYPYGAGPTPEAAVRVRRTYSSACTATATLAAPRVDVFRLPRIDVHYLRREDRLARAIDGRPGGYVSGRLLAARARRVLTGRVSGLRKSGVTTSPSAWKPDTEVDS